MARISKRIARRSPRDARQTLSFFTANADKGGYGPAAARARNSRRANDFKPFQSKRKRAAMNSDNKSLVLPILLIIIGLGWLLSTLGFAPGIDWVWTLCLAAVGLLTFIVGGLDKITVVVGTFFVVTSCLSVLRQTGRINFDVEIPILIILAGVLLLVARSPIVPAPKWFYQLPKDKAKPGKPE